MTPSLSLRPEGEGADVRLLFHNQPTGGARVLSGTIVHVLAATALVLLARFIPDRFIEAVLPQRLPKELVFLVDPGPGGGGGGGNKSPEPPPPAQLKGPDQITVPTLTPPEPLLESVNIERPPEPAAISAQPMAAATQVAIGAPLGTGPSGNSRGPGDDGVGTQKGPNRPGTDGRPYQPGNGVLPPRVRLKVDPQYSVDAMRAKIQGMVVVSAVVLPDGSVTDVRVIRSLDRSFGLDLKAIEAARQWRFFPGTRQGEPVPVLVNIELEFNLR
jgi:periplasmic protein TonB